MKNVSKLGLLAFIIAAVAALAFTPQKSKPTIRVAKNTGAEELVWLKFDCNNPGTVQTFGDRNWTDEPGNPTEDEFAPCTGGTPTICAVQVDKAYTYEVGGNPNIIDLISSEYLPNPAEFPQRYVYCEPQ